MGISYLPRQILHVPREVSLPVKISKLSGDRCPFTSLGPKTCSAIVRLGDCKVIDPANSTPIASDLFLMNKKACMLFIRDIGDRDALLQEAQNLSFEKRALKNVDGLVRFLESAAMQPGDAVYARFMSKWYSSITSELKEELKTAYHRHLFDPTILAVGIIQDLGQTLCDTNGLDARSNDILIPMSFIRSWAVSLHHKIKEDMTYLVKMAKIVS
jgi:hypothetical protein